MVKDVTSVKSLRSYMTNGRDRTLASQFLDYLVRYNDRTRSVVHGKSRLLHEEEARVRRVLQVNRRVVTPHPTPKKRLGMNVVPDYMRKQRRIALEQGTRGNHGGGWKIENEVPI